MGVKPAIFQSGGQASQHYIPGAYSRVDFVKSGGGSASINNGVIMGDSRGGEPGKLLDFGSISEARAVLRSGPLLEAIISAFTPGGGAVPQKISGWRVNPGTRSSRMLKSSALNIIELKAWDWGLHGNQVQTKMEAGTNLGTKKLSVLFQTNPTVVQDNVERKSFNLQYTGAGTAATMNIGSGTLTTSITGGPGGENLNVDLASFPTIETLVNYLNNQPGYACAAVTGNPQELTAHLDAVTSANVKTIYTAKSDVQAIVETFASMPWIGSSQFVGAARTIPDNDTGWVFMGGGTDGAYTQTEWVAALSALENEDVQFVGASTPTESIHILIKEHCVKASSVSGKAERQYLLGGAAGESVDQAVSRASVLASEYGAILYPGFKTYDDTGAVVTLSPVHYAARELGRQTTLALNEPATNKEVNVLEWEKTLTTAEQEKLIRAGVWCGVKTRNGRFINCRSITTTQDSALQKVEFSMMREALFASRDLREAIEATFIGRPGTKYRLADIDVLFVSKTAGYVSDLQIFLGKPKNYIKRVVGDQVIVEYDADLVAPINFGFITAHFSVYASTQV